METKHSYIEGIPAVLWGALSDKVFLYVHGQGGNKEEAENLAEIAVKYSYQVLSIDLPQHGERKSSTPTFEPWNVIPELVGVMNRIHQNWRKVSLYANSIGAWFSMLAFEKMQIERCMFVSPVVDMQRLILNMMQWANVSERQLQKEKLIPTNFGQTLSWKYFIFAKENTIKNWDAPTRILCGDRDSLIPNSVVSQFSRRFHCELTTMTGGEHWFHTQEQLKVLYEWVERDFKKGI